MRILMKSLGVMLPIVAVLLLVIQVVISNNLATLNKRMGQLDSSVAKAQDIHEVLETQVASASSLLSLREKAALLGFHDPGANQLITISPEIPVAFRVQ